MPTNTMKAIRLHEFGGPEVLRYEEAPIPELKPGEVLVRVHAVGINPPDWYLRDGYKMFPPEWCVFQSNRAANPAESEQPLQA